MILSPETQRIYDENCARLSRAQKDRYIKKPHLKERVRQFLVPGGSLGKHWKKTEEQLANVRGEKNPSWRGGITPTNLAIRGSAKYAEWRKKVFERDNYTCTECGATGVFLHADHIKTFALHPELRFEVSNGRTLCVPCHRDTPTWGRRALLQAV